MLDFGAAGGLPGGFPPVFGRVLRLVHDGGDPAGLEEEFRSHGYLRDGVSVDLAAVRAFLAPLAEPSRAESFRFSREWLRAQTAQTSALRSSSVLRRLSLPPSYVLIHRVLASGLGVLCQLECEAPFRAEVLRWMPGYAVARPGPRAGRRARPARPAWLEQTAPEQIAWSHVQWRDIMAKLPRPQAPARFRAMFPDLADWLESPWAGPPPFLAGHVFRLEETIRDGRFMIRAELPGLDPDKDIEVTVDGRILTIRAERRQHDTGPYRSEFRYGSLARAVRLPARVDPGDVAARYDKGVLEVSVPVRAARPEGTQIPVQDAGAAPGQPPGQAG